MDIPRAYSVKEACELMKISRSKFYREVKSGRLIARKNGGRTVVLSHDLENWLKNPLTQQE